MAIKPKPRLSQTENCDLRNFPNEAQIHLPYSAQMLRNQFGLLPYQAKLLAEKLGYDMGGAK